MKNIEKILREGKLEIDNLEIPIELESRMRGALEKQGAHRSRKASYYSRGKRMKTAAAAILILLVFLGYNFDTLAFYGKRLIGYEGIMNGTLKQLNDAGKGQLIGKSHTFANGLTFTLDGIMLDENQLLAFYTVKDPLGRVGRPDMNEYLMLRGSMGRYMIKSSQGSMNNEKTEIKYIASFETPFFLEKRLALDISIGQGQKLETASIEFILERDKAMGHMLKKSIDKSIKVDETKVHFESILASPTETVIKGSLEGMVGLALDTLREERFRPKDLNIQLLANGRELPVQGNGVTTDMHGITFSYRYDVLPPDLTQLQLKLVSLGSDHDVKQLVKLDRSVQQQYAEIMGQRIDILEIIETGGDTYITISTEDSVFLTNVKLLMDGKKAELEETFADEHIKNADGTITHTRTLHFPGVGKELKLDIEKMSYTKVYNQIIDIPVD